MTAKAWTRTAGWVIALSPMAALFAFCCADKGLPVALAIFGFVAVVFAIVAIGMKLALSE